MANFPGKKRGGCKGFYLSMSARKQPPRRRNETSEAEKLAKLLTDALLRVPRGTFDRVMKEVRKSRCRAG